VRRQRLRIEPAIIVLGVVRAFLYLDGWFNPQALTAHASPKALSTSRESIPVFASTMPRPFASAALFESNGQGSRLSKAVVFDAGYVPIIGRFSLTGGYSYFADESEMVRRLGFLFKPA